MTSQEKALAFYTGLLGFQKKNDVPLGDARWLTVVSPADPDGPELVLEPDSHPAAKPFKEAIVADGIPFTSFAVDDVTAEHERLVGLGEQPRAVDRREGRGDARADRQPQKRPGQVVVHPHPLRHHRRK